MARFVSLPPVVGAPGEVHTTLMNPLNTIAKDENGYEYVYLKGVSSLVSGDAVIYDEVGVTTLLTDDQKGPVAIATAAVDANTKWGWFGIRGTFAANGVANIADNSTLGKETTAGKVGGGRGVGEQIANCFARDSWSGAAAVTWPVTGAEGEGVVG